MILGIKHTINHFFHFLVKSHSQSPELKNIKVWQSKGRHKLFHALSSTVEYAKCTMVKIRSFLLISRVTLLFTFQPNNQRKTTYSPPKSF